jgi:hypothetical protein
MNFTRSNVLSGLVSGAFARYGLLKAAIEGPQLLTGGKFGMKRSVLALLVCTTAGVVMPIAAVVTATLCSRYGSAGADAPSLPFDCLNPA